MGELTFILGGARSGKSTYAETWAASGAGPVLFVATAQGFDDEMRDRIASHRAQRPPDWDTLEAPLDVGGALHQQLRQRTYATVVVDCLTLLASNVLLTLPDDCTQADATAAILSETDALLAVTRGTGARWLIVSNEVGMGVVPPSRLGRFYRDALGRANQQVAGAADTVLLIVAGLPWRLKPV